jgi:hypothetical protein
MMRVSRRLRDYDLSEAGGGCLQDLWGRSLTGLASAAQGEDNTDMEIQGRVQNGVIVLEGGQTLPEGTTVMVVPCMKPVIRKAKKQGRVEFPLVRSKHPGTLHLTNQRIAEILDEEDVSPRH